MDRWELLSQKFLMSNGQGTAGNVLACLASFFIPGLGQLGKMAQYEADLAHHKVRQPDGIVQHVHDMMLGAPRL